MIALIQGVGVGEGGLIKDVIPEKEQTGWLCFIGYILCFIGTSWFI